MKTGYINLNIETEELARRLAADGITLLALVRAIDSPERLIASDPRYDWLAKHIEQMDDYDRHEAVLFGFDNITGGLFIDAVHNSHRGQALGGCREDFYPTVETAVRDVLRLSRGMTRKNAISAIWYGGGKGILCRIADRDYADKLLRRAVYQSWGRFVAAQDGYYVTAEDMNNTVEDTGQMLAANRYTACVPRKKGGSGNPSPFTASSVHYAMLAAAQQILQRETLAGLIVNVQGAGNVGLHLIKLLIDDGAKVRAGDVNPKAIERLQKEFPSVEILTPSQIISAEGDIFAPCAKGAILNPETIPLLKIKIVCGAANNMLARKDRDGQALLERGIVDCVDYNCNRGGVINAAQEIDGYLAERVEEKVMQAYEDTQSILYQALIKKVPPHVIADEIADERAMKIHPTKGYIGPEYIKRYLALQQKLAQRAA